MDAIERIVLTADLQEAECGLNHGSYIPLSVQAVDYIVVPIGYTENSTVSVVTRELVVPVCAECAETLHSNDPEWVLFLCTNCSSSQWKLRSLLRREYSNDILQLLKYCPGCIHDIPRYLRWEAKATGQRICVHFDSTEHGIECTAKNCPCDLYEEEVLI